MSISNHVEVAANHPRYIARGRDGFQFIKEENSKLGRGGSIDVGKEKGKIGGGRSKVDREGVGVEVESTHFRRESFHAERIPPDVRLALE